MLNQIPHQPTSEANSSGIFLKNYLDYIEELPDEIIRIITKVRELDVKTSNIVNEAEELSEKIVESSGEAKSKLYSRLQQILITLQDFNDEKIRYNQHLSELIETKFRSVERDFQNNLASKTERPQSPISSASSTARNASIVQQVLSNLPLKNSSTTGSNISSSTNNSASEQNVNANGTDKGSKRIRRTRNEITNAELERAETPVKNETNKASTSGNNQSSSTSAKKNSSSSSLAANNLSKKNKKKKAGGGGKQATSNANQSNQVVEQVSSQLDEAIDPDEETYCLCGQISYGEMILCENDACKIEWFHFSCVSLTNKPKGRWYCPNCRGDRPNVLNKNLRKKYQDSPNTDRKFM